MKIALGQKVTEGPWGGGNNFAKSLLIYLQSHGHTVIDTLDDDDIDIILMTDPRKRNPNAAFVAGDILRYLMFRNPNALVVHRINECDERKNTKTMNFRLRLSNYAADHTVLIGSWLKDLKVWRKDNADKYSVILNGADSEVFHDNGHRLWDGNEPLRLVTHHWGGNIMKGFDVYRVLDELLDTEQWRGKLEFTYIGNLPSGFSFKYAQHIPPDSGESLAEKLRQNHVYITASINEPAGMHHIEGALCGLPLLFRSSGALPEYCSGFGEAFTSPTDFEDALIRMRDNYTNWQQQLKNYPHTSHKMVSEYTRLFEDLIENRDKLIQGRHVWRDPIALLLNQIPV